MLDSSTLTPSLVMKIAVLPIDSEQPKINSMGNIQVRKLVESRVVFIFVAAAA